jgi:hypothetical protein
MPSASDPTRYEAIMLASSERAGDLAARFAGASRAARAAVPAESRREAAIRDVAAGVAALALVAFVLWLMEEAERRGLRRLRFLSRDGQVLYELARRLATVTGTGLDLEYVYSSRLTWSLAATDVSRLAETPWLLNSFIKSNAGDVCARLGLPFEKFRPVMADCGVSLDPGERADQPAQADALRRFVATPQVIRATGERIATMRGFVLDYAAQHQLADSGTGLVDIGWTGRMAGSFIELCESAGMGRPAVLFWGHEPRATGWTDPDTVAAYMYNTATGQGLHWRVPNVPFIMETFCMADHGIVSGYRRDPTGRSTPSCSRPAMTRQRTGAWDCTGRRCTPSRRPLTLVPDSHRATCARWCIRLWRLSGATRLWMRRLPGAATRMTATRPGPLSGLWHGRSPPPIMFAETVPGLPGHLH